jgi:O-antigen/teichoic acid export membrane protein
MGTLKALLARAVTLVVGLVCGLAIAHLVIREGGETSYAAYATIVALPALVPFVDLGAGASLVNRLAGAAVPDEDLQVRYTALTVLRVMLGFASGLALLDLLAYSTGGWAWVLGDTSSPLAARVGFIAVLVYACGIPLFIGSRVLLGLERTHALVLAQGLQTPLTLLFVLITMRTTAVSDSAVPLALCAFVAMFAVLAISAALAHRLLPRTSRWLRSRLFHLRSVRGAKVMDMGWPVFVQTLATPLATQLDRIVLAHLTNAGEVARYSLAAQLYAPLLGLAGTAGVTLWPMFKRQASQGVRPRPLVLACVFGIGGALVGSVIWAVSPVMFDAISGGSVDVPPLLLLAFTVMLAAQCSLQPLGMFLMDPVGVRQQLLPVALMITANLGLSIVLAQELGAAGPVLASGVAILVFQVLPFTYFVSRRLARGNRRPVTTRGAAGGGTADW